MTTDRFDPDKDAINRAKHGLPLLFGDQVMSDPEVLIVPSLRAEDGEERYKAIGEVGGKLYTAVFVWRASEEDGGDELARFISVRRSNGGEKRLRAAAER